MRILLIETSGTAGSVALADESGVLAEESLPAARKQARDLAPKLQSLLRSRDWKPASVELVLVDVGPGSYTGLRVGLTTAKTFCYLSKAALVGVTTPRLSAENAPASMLDVHVIVDAQQGKVYADHFRRSRPAGPLEPGAPTRILEAVDWAAGLPAGAYATGPAMARYADLLAGRATAAAGAEWEPRIEALWKLGLADFNAGRRDDFWKLEPLYLRASSAEIKWDRLHPPK
jgi:tRNA threonylcarbamoyladenosine biosynthesis protein TsaB